MEYEVVIQAQGEEDGEDSDEDGDGDGREHLAALLTGLCIT